MKLSEIVTTAGTQIRARIDHDTVDDYAEAMQDAAIMKPIERGTRPYTKRELALIEQFRKDMGGMMPTWWEGKTAFQIAEAGIKAVRDFRP